MNGYSVSVRVINLRRQSGGKQLVLNIILRLKIITAQMVVGLCDNSSIGRIRRMDKLNERKLNVNLLISGGSMGDKCK